MLTAKSNFPNSISGRLLTVCGGQRRRAPMANNAAPLLPSGCDAFWAAPTFCFPPNYFLLLLPDKLLSPLLHRLGRLLF